MNTHVVLFTDPCVYTTSTNKTWNLKLKTDEGTLDIIFLGKNRFELIQAIKKAESERVKQEKNESSKQEDGTLKVQNSTLNRVEKFLDDYGGRDYFDAVEPLEVIDEALVLLKDILRNAKE